MSSKSSINFTLPQRRQRKMTFQKDEGTAYWSLIKERESTTELKITLSPDSWFSGQVGILYYH